MDFKNEQFILRAIEKLMTRRLDRLHVIEHKVVIGKSKEMNLGVLLPVNHVLEDVFVKVFVPALSKGAISLGPKEAKEGYIDAMPIDTEGIHSPGPAVLAGDDGVEEIIGKTRGSLLSYGKKNVYVPRTDASGAGLPIILTCHGDCEGAEIKICFKALEIMKT